MIMWDRRMKQAELAEALGLEQSALSKRLRGERGWSVSEVLIAARHLGTTISYLAGETDNPHPDQDPDGDGGVRHQGLEPRTRWLNSSPSQSTVARRLIAA